MSKVKDMLKWCLEKDWTSVCALMLFWIRISKSTVGSFRVQSKLPLRPWQDFHWLPWRWPGPRLTTRGQDLCFTAEPPTDCKTKLNKVFQVTVFLSAFVMRLYLLNNWSIDRDQFVVSIPYSGCFDWSYRLRGMSHFSDWMNVTSIIKLLV